MRLDETNNLAPFPCLFFFIDRHMPLRTVTIRHRSYPWLEDETVREAMAARDAARLDRDLTPCEETQQEFRARRNAVKVALNTYS